MERLPRQEPYAVDLNLEVIFSPSVAFLGGAFRPALGATINFYGDTSKVYLDARWQRDFASGMFLALGLGVAVHNGSALFDTYIPDPDAKELGRRVLFHPHVEIGYRLDEHRSVSVFFEHISNASTARQERGPGHARHSAGPPVLRRTGVDPRRLGRATSR